MSLTRTFSVGLVAAATIALSACSSGGEPAPASTGDPASQSGICSENGTPEAREACLDDARQSIRDYLDAHPEEDVPAAPPADATPVEDVQNPPGWEPVD